jgi:hypothetical protein
MEALYRVHKLLIDGLFPVWAHPYIVSQRLFALGEKVRPVCVGEFLMRSASAFVNKTVSPEKDKRFFLRKVKGRYAAQLGTAVKGGAEVLVHLLGTLVHAPGSRNVCVSDDGENAFNENDRVNGCNKTVRQNPSTHRWINWLYGNPAMLMVGDECLWGREGVFQGEPLAGRIHDTALQGPLEEAVGRTAIQYPNSQVHIVAFRDDAYIVGGAEEALFCHEQFKQVRKEQTNVNPSVAKVFAYVSDLACSGGGQAEKTLLDYAINEAMSRGGVGGGRGMRWSPMALKQSAPPCRSVQTLSRIFLIKL